MLNKAKHSLFFFFNSIKKQLFRKDSSGNQYVILMYHQISRFNNEFNPSSRISFSDFKWQIEFLARHCNVISLKEMIGYIKEKRGGSDLFCAITFDDGYEDNFNLALPLLQERKLSATFFLSTDFIDYPDVVPWWDRLEYITFAIPIQDIIIEYGKRFDFSRPNVRELFFLNKRKIIMQNYKDREKIIDSLVEKYKIRDMPNTNRFIRWEFIKSLDSKFFDFGSHTCSHDLSLLMNMKKFESEVLESKHRIESQLNKEVSVFAYPYGDKKTMEKLVQTEILRRNRFIGALTAQLGCNSNESDIFLLKRVGIGPFCSSELHFKNYLFFPDDLNIF